MIRKKKTIVIGCLLFSGLLGLFSCGSPSSDSGKLQGTDRVKEAGTGEESETEGKSGKGAGAETEAGAELVYKNSMELQYAENFSVDYYEGGYTMLTTDMDGARFLIVPENKEVPENLEAGTVVLKRPIKDIYLVASASMNIFCELDGLDAIAFSGQKEDGWYIEAAREAMAEGNILYAGKYSKPDYELIVSKGCSLAIENMMISHSPEVV